MKQPRGVLHKSDGPEKVRCLRPAIEFPVPEHQGDAHIAETIHERVQTGVVPIALLVGAQIAVIQLLEFLTTRLSPAKDRTTRTPFRCSAR